MREILFRGKRLDNGEWVEGCLCKHPSAIQGPGYAGPWYIHVPPKDPDDNGGVYNVAPSTVGQFTGITDKNGRKVFEGDVVCAEDGYGHVKWDDDGARFVIVGNGVVLGFDQYFRHEVKIMGTIYDYELEETDGC